MTGPELATANYNNQELPLPVILANHIADKHLKDHKIKAPERNNLFHVAREFKLNEGKNALYPVFQEFYLDPKFNQPNEVIRKLSLLPFHLVITSNPDQCFIEAYKDKKEKMGINFNSGFYDYKGFTKETEVGTLDKPLIYGLYGSPDEPDSLVTTEETFLDYLINFIGRKPALPSDILVELKKPNKIFLFLGFGFDNWYLRVILHLILDKNRDNPCFALEEFNTAELDSFDQTKRFYKQFNILILESNIKKFVADLSDKYDKSTAGKKITTVRASNFEGDLPRIFICHSSENKDFAATLTKRLSDEGFEPWLDKRDLEGGDTYKTEIKSIIEEQTDYFLVLLGKEMTKKGRSFFWFEINTAISVFNEMNQNENKFIIPVQFEDEDIKLKILKDIHYVRLAKNGKIIESAIKELVNTVKRDRQLNQRK